MDLGAWWGPVLFLWAQAAGPGGGGSGVPAPAPATNPYALGPLALRRWFASLTLSAPDSQPGAYPWLACLAALGLLLALALVFQGPGRALRQLFDVPGHARLAALAVGRLRRAGRLLCVTIGATVLSWTGSQAVTFASSQAREDLILLTKSRTLAEAAGEQGALAALTPLRDVAGLGSNLALLALAGLLLFRATAESWGGGPPLPGLPPPRARVSGWAVVGWVSAALYILYRLAALAGGAPDLPLGGCLTVEAVVVPAVMLLADGTLLAYVLTELRNAGFAEPDGGPFDPAEAVALMPAAALACAAALPARYLATGAFLASGYLPASLRATPVGSYLRWQLLWGLTDTQAVALAFAGLAGAVAWTRGGLGEALGGFARVLAAEGARLAVTLAAAGVVAGLASAAAYAALLSLPSASWVLAAADSYAHYATLPVGLATLAALVELAERALPVAELAPLDPAPEDPI